jgi:hypothetical protein
MTQQAWKHNAESANRLLSTHGIPGLVGFRSFRKKKRRTRNRPHLNPLEYIYRWLYQRRGPYRETRNYFAIPDPIIVAEAQGLHQGKHGTSHQEASGAGNEYSGLPPRLHRRLRHQRRDMCGSNVTNDPQHNESVHGKQLHVDSIRSRASRYQTCTYDSPRRLG